MKKYVTKITENVPHVDNYVFTVRFVNDDWHTKGIKR